MAIIIRSNEHDFWLKQEAFRYDWIELEIFNLTKYKFRKFWVQIII